MKILLKSQELFFDSSKNQYDTYLLHAPPPHTNKELSEIEEKLVQNSIRDVVDFGSGNGRCSLFLVKKGYVVTAVDISKESLGILKKIGATFIKRRLLNTIKKLDTPNGSNAIVGADILHHISFAEYFIFFYKNLKSNGLIVFSEPNMCNIFWYIFLIASAILKKQSINELFEVEKGILQCNIWNIKKNLQRYGFCNIEIEGHGLFPTPLFNKFPEIARFNYFLGRLPIFRWFSYRLIITAHKGS